MLYCLPFSLHIFFSSGSFLFFLAEAHRLCSFTSFLFIKNEFPSLPSFWVFLKTWKRFIFLRLNFQASLQCVLNGGRSFDPNVYAVSESLCTSLAGNEVPIVTITAAGSPNEMRLREVIVFLARVHPGESNSSWVMHGLFQFLT